MEAVIIIVALFFIAIVTNRGKRVRRRSYRQHHDSFSKYDFTDWDAYSEQEASPSDISIVANTNYRPRSVMNREEAYLFYKIEKWLSTRTRGERVFVQMPMGTYLQTPNNVAHKIIRHKYPDYVIVDRAGKPVCVIEYQGGGHSQGDAYKRAKIKESDEIKKVALANANIPLVEIFEHEKDDEALILSKLDGAVSEPDSAEIVPE